LTNKRREVYEGYLYVIPYCGDHYFVSPKRKEPDRDGFYAMDDEDKSIDLGDFIDKKVRITIEVME